MCIRDRVKKGAPIRIEIGPKDMESSKVCLQRRDQAPNEKSFVPKEDFIRNATEILKEIHQTLLERATKLRNDNISHCDNLNQFISHWGKKDPGWLLTPWSGTREQEETLSKEHKITIRCMPLDKQQEDSLPCILTGEATTRRALWGRSY